MAELCTPQGHSILLPEGRVTIGTDLSNEVPVAAHFGLAPAHFRLQPWEGGYFIEDAGSGLGTLVNGHPINWKPLIHGDVIAAGNLEVIYSQQAQPSLPGVPTQPIRLAGVRPAPALPPAVPLLIPAESSALHMFPPPPPPPSAHPKPQWQAPAAAPPPAWLPEDLLPAAYRHSPVPEFSSEYIQTSGHPLASGVDASPYFASGKNRNKSASGPFRKLLKTAALLGFLVWGGHTLWQNGTLQQYLPEMTNQGNAKPSPPQNEESPAPVVSLPKSTQPSPSPSNGQRIANQNP